MNQDEKLMRRTLNAVQALHAECERYINQAASGANPNIIDLASLATTVINQTPVLRQALQENPRLRQRVHTFAGVKQRQINKQSMFRAGETGKPKKES